MKSSKNKMLLGIINVSFEQLPSIIQNKDVYDR